MMKQRMRKVANVKVTEKDWSKKSIMIESWVVTPNLVHIHWTVGGNARRYCILAIFGNTLSYYPEKLFLGFNITEAKNTGAD